MLSPCPSCARHVSAADRSCPFCGAATEGARPGPLRLVSRRELTRAAIFAGAALFAGACGGPEIVYDDEDDSAGGDSLDDDTGFSRGVDDGSAERSDTSADSDAERREALAREEEAARREREAREEALRLREEQRRLEDEQFHRRRRSQCTPQGICPPYGAPPVRDELV